MMSWLGVHLRSARVGGTNLLQGSGQHAKLGIVDVRPHQVHSTGRSHKAGRFPLEVLLERSRDSIIALLLPLDVCLAVQLCRQLLEGWYACHWRCLTSLTELKSETAQQSYQTPLKIFCLSERTLSHGAPFAFELVFRVRIVVRVR
jgi:hypothetical protein